MLCFAVLATHTQKKKLERSGNNVADIHSLFNKVHQFNKYYAPLKAKSSVAETPPLQANILFYNI